MIHIEAASNEHGNLIHRTIYLMDKRGELKYECDLYTGNTVSVFFRTGALPCQ